MGSFEDQVDWIDELTKKKDPCVGSSEAEENDRAMLSTKH